MRSGPVITCLAYRGIFGLAALPGFDLACHVRAKVVRARGSFGVARPAVVVPQLVVNTDQPPRGVRHALSVYTNFASALALYIQCPVT